jgi:hypothetical protein
MDPFEQVISSQKKWGALLRFPLVPRVKEVWGCPHLAHFCFGNMCQNCLYDNLCWLVAGGAPCACHIVAARMIHVNIPFLYMCPSSAFVIFLYLKGTAVSGGCPHP